MNNEVWEKQRRNDDDSFEYKYGMEPTLACHIPYSFHFPPPCQERKGKEREGSGDWVRSSPGMAMVV